MGRAPLVEHLAAKGDLLLWPNPLGEVRGVLDLQSLHPHGVPGVRSAQIYELLALVDATVDDARVRKLAARLLLDGSSRRTGQPAMSLELLELGGATTPAAPSCCFGLKPWTSPWPLRARNSGSIAMTTSDPLEEARMA